MCTGPRHLAAPPDSLDDDPIISTLMTTRIFAITPDTPVSTALSLMASARVRHLPVLYGDRCGGVLREADVIQHLAASPTFPVDRAATPVGRLSRPVPSVPPSARRSDAARRMDGDHTDVVLVSDRHGLVGIVTAGDLIQSLAGEALERPKVVRSVTGVRPSVSAGTDNAMAGTR